MASFNLVILAGEIYDRALRERKEFVAGEGYPGGRTSCHEP